MGEIFRAPSAEGSFSRGAQNRQIKSQAGKCLGKQEKYLRKVRYCQALAQPDPNNTLNELFKCVIFG
jgi:hypothetical protein